MRTPLITDYDKALIITHTDLDGYGSGALLFRSLRALGFEEDNIKIVNTGYEKLPIESEYKLTLISDISIATDDAAKQLIEYIKLPGTMLFWFDHHQSSIDMYEKYPLLKDILGIRDVRACGTMLCWMFYQIVSQEKMVAGEDKYDLNNKIIDVLKGVDVGAAIRGPGIGVLSEYASREGYRYDDTSKSSRIRSTPYLILLTDDYDRFVLAIEESKYLMEAFNSCPIVPKNNKDPFWTNRFMRLTKNNDIVKTMLSTGRDLYNYRNIIFLNQLLTYGFIANFDMSEKNATAKQDVICMCSVAKGSLQFGDLLKSSKSHPYFNYACVYSYKDDQVSGSIYFSANNKGVDDLMNAEAVCKKYSGGGHPEAAGFVYNKFPFVNVRPLPDGVKKYIQDQIRDIFNDL